MRQVTPYALTGLGLVVGLAAILFTPLGSRTANYLVGAAFLGVAVAAITYMIVAFGGPGERGPDF